MRMAALLTLTFLLSACTSFYSVAPRDVLKASGNLSVVSTALVMGSDKTLADHIYSFSTGKDCSTVRQEKGHVYCREDEPNPIQDLKCYRTLGDVMCYSQADPTGSADNTVGNL